MAGLMGLIKHYTNIKLLPSVDVAESLSFKAIAFGFPLFTIATILGSLWAYEAWGAYWSWDPKETWALIVWLIYAIYLHLRVTNRVSKNTLCIISFIALLATAFCFLGVNLYLSGLHSYGQLS
jgi:cytochrome c-type biogenesis protein CcsB